MKPARHLHDAPGSGGEAFPDARGSVHTRFESIAAAQPDRVSAVGPDGRATYAELNRWANAIARALLDAGLRPEEPVALAVPRSIAQVAALLGVLKAGGAYVPLVDNQPEARLRSIAAGAGCRIAVAQPGYLDAVVGGMHRTIDPATLRARDEPNPSLPIAPDRLAYIMFTSGSTGESKGAMIEHRGVVRLVCGQDYMPFGPDFHFLYAGPLSFDLSTIEIFTPLLHGAKLLISPDDVLAPETLRRFASDENLRGVCVSFSLFRALFEADPGAFDAIPTIGVCGEPADPAVIRRAQERLPNASFYNAYGPTECTSLSTTHQIPRPCPLEPPVVPIGIPLNTMRLRVVDDAAADVPPGDTGELLIGGLGVGRGYLNDPTLTAARFITDPAGDRWYRSGDRVRIGRNHALEYLGRADDQVKIRGQRIELGEIDAALRADPAVTAAASVMIGSGAVARVGACVVPAVDPFDPAALLRRLAERLMPAMVPTIIVPVAALPINRNGKSDRARVAEIVAAAMAESSSQASRTDRDTPRSDTERALMELVASVTGHPVADPRQGFVALGGHSLQAMGLSMRIRQRWGVRVPVTRILGSRSILDLASEIDHASAEPGPAPAPATMLSDGPRSLTPPERRMWTVQQMDPDSGVYNIAYRFFFRDGGPDRQRLSAAWSRLIDRHPALRAAFSEPGASQPTVTIHSHAEPSIEWLDAFHGAIPVDAIRRPFDLNRPPLARLLVTGDDAAAGYLVMHHIVSDAWSMEVMLRDLDAFYRSGDEATLPALASASPAEPDDIKAPDRARALADQLRTVPYTALPAAEPASEADAAADTTLAPVPADLARRAEHMAAEMRVTAHSVYLAAYAAWVAGLIGRDRLCIGLLVSTRDDAQRADEVGFFVETVPVVLTAGGASFEDAVRSTARAVAEAHARRDVPFDRLAGLMAAPRDAARTPVTDVFFNSIDPAPIEWPDEADRAIQPDRIEVEHGLARFGLLTTLYRTDGDIRVTTAVRHGMASAAGVVPHADAFVDHLRASLDGVRPAAVSPTHADHPGRPASGWDGRDRRSSGRMGRSGHVVLTVLSVFREVLEDPDFQPTDDFFVRGGNSLHAVRAFAMIRQRLGTHLPTATIFRHPTPERLAEVIRQDPAGLALRPFLQLTEHPRPRTAYILPGVTGEIISMGDLVRGLGDRWGCFAAAYPGVSEQTEPVDSIDAMTDHLVSGLHDNFDHESSALVGYSFGGIIAYELAMRLQAEDRTPRLLVLLDTHLMSRFPTPSQRVPVMIHLENLRRLRGERRLKYLYRRYRNIRRALLSSPPEADEYDAQPHIRRLNDAHLMTLQGYRPSGVYHGRVLVVNGHRPDWMLPEDDDGANGWRSSLSRPPVTLRLDANHVQLIRPGAAEMVSRRISEAADPPTGGVI